MRVGVLGAGAVGAGVARHLQAVDAVQQIVVRDIRPSVETQVVADLAPDVVADGKRLGPLDVDVLVLATPVGFHVRQATKALERGISVVSVSDSLGDVQGLLRLRGLAEETGSVLVIGAGFSPGLTGVIAGHAAGRLARVDEVHIAKMGTGGPACARQHHRALKNHSLDWRDGVWTRRPGGSGRELVWFPSPVDAHDCYRAELPDTVLAVPCFPSAQRVTARVSATRRDRLTMHLPMLRRPHPEGLVGAVRVEVRGELASGGFGSIIMGSVAAPAVGAAATAATAVEWVTNKRVRPGGWGLGQLRDLAGFLHATEQRGVATELFEGLAEMAADPAPQIIDLRVPTTQSIQKQDERDDADLAGTAKKNQSR